MGVGPAGFEALSAVPGALTGAAAFDDVGGGVEVASEDGVCGHEAVCGIVLQSWGGAKSSTHIQGKASVSEASALEMGFWGVSRNPGWVSISARAS